MSVNAYTYLHICACSPHVHGACEGQKRTSQSLELELHTV